MTKSFYFYLILTAALCGALIMVIEILGSRIIGPFYGVSLYVWTSLIAVTMIALAAGYAVGGRIADKYPTPSVLYGLIAGAGAFTLIIPFIQSEVLVACQPMGLRMGAFISATILFGPPLALLGCVSPYVVRLAARETKNLGRTVGSFYALSTLGSVGGTVATGFWLIGILGISSIMKLTGGALISIAIVYFVVFGRKKTAIAPAILLALVALPVDQIVRAGVMPDGTKITVQHMEESFYGRIQVLDFSYKEHLLRELMIDGMVQGGTDPRSGLAAYETVVLMERLPLLLTKSPERALVIGLGPGTMPIFYEKNGVTTDVVDIDPAVIETARKWFDFNISGNVYIEDARQVVSTLSKPYDIIILDIFNGDVQPAHVMSLEALKDIKRILKPGGVLTINIVGALKGRTRMTESVVKTLDAAGFNQIDLYPMFEMIDTEDDLWGNIVLTAYEGSKRHIDLTRLQDWPVNIMANNAMTFIQTPIRIEPTVQAIILSDDYAPLDVEDAWMREAVRLSIQGNLDPSLLMGE